MTAMTVPPPTGVVGHDTLRAVLCGSFRRDREGLARAHAELSDAFELLAPAGLDFVDPDAEFVRLPGELHESVVEIENRHLDAILNADFVWLHAPDGYVGTSAALELGHARAIGVPVFASEAPADDTLSAYVQVVPNPAGIADLLTPAPGRGLSGLQAYYRRIADRRGWSSESATDTLLLITEEIGELAREVRKARGLARDHAYSGALASEIADVQLYLVHLATALDVDIASAVTEKERINANRFQAKTATDVA